MFPIELVEEDKQKHVENAAVPPLDPHIGQAFDDAPLATKLPEGTLSLTSLLNYAQESTK